MFNKWQLFFFVKVFQSPKTTSAFPWHFNSIKQKVNVFLLFKECKYKWYSIGPEWHLIFAIQSQTDYRDRNFGQNRRKSLSSFGLLEFYGTWRIENVFQFLNPKSGLLKASHLVFYYFYPIKYGDILFNKILGT